MQIFLFFLLVGVYLIIKSLWKGSGSDAPFVPTDPDVVERIMKIAKVGKGDVFVDLGSGDGRLVIAAALKGARAVGVESNWLKVLYSRLIIRLLGLKGQADILHGNLFDLDLSKATVVSLYLLQETNDKIQKKLEKELKRGTRVVSVAFEFKDWKSEKIEKKGVVYGPLRLYVVK